MTAELARAGPRVPPVARPIILGVGIAWALAAEAIRLGGDWPVIWVLGDLLPGLAFLGCGYVAWIRAPGNRIGPLMMAVGFTWYAGTASTSGIAAIDRPAHALQGYYDAFLAWLILAYPSGRLQWRASHAVVGLFLAVLVARTVFRFIVFPTTLDLDVSDPLAVDRYVALVSLREAGDTLFRVLISILAAAVLVLTVARWRAETNAGRAIAGPILIGGAGFAIGIVVEAMTYLRAGDFAERSFAWDVGHWLTIITVSVIPVAFLFGLGQDRIARGRVADLVVGLGETGPARDDLQTTLARTLGDPTLIVAYPIAGSDGFVDMQGRPVSLPQRDDRRAVTTVDRAGRAVAVLIHDAALSERPELMTSVAAATGLALENEQLQAELRVQLDAVQASRARIVAAGDAERRRVERDLHDGAQQRFVTLALALQLARTRLADDQTEVAGMLDRAGAELERGLAELRELARGIHPTVLTEDGLAAAVGALAERSVVPISMDVPDRRFEAQVESTAYYVIAEALANVAKYAPRASVSVTVRHEPGSLVVEVHDDGPGGAAASPGSGLQGLEDRVAAIRGRFSVDSPPGGGTTLRAVIPCG